MKATETRVEDFLSSNKTQFIIPVYQRNYDWTQSQCKQLLDDILEVGSSKEMDAHFIGSIVYVHDDVYTSSRIKELSIIDGQQRLTTLTLIYLVLYRLAIEMNDEGLKNEISETYLINKFASEDEKLKLRPTENNDKALKFLLNHDENDEFLEYSKLIDNFNYFKTRITEENFNFVLDGLSKLMFVEISLDRVKDDPQRIFESLNSTGLELSQADLIRNYILMGLDRDSQNKVYEKYWEVIEKLAKDEQRNASKVSDFIRDFLTLENKKIPNKSKVYEEFKKKFPTSSVRALESTLVKIKQYAKHYNKLINPSNENDFDLRKELEYIARLEINVAFPFLLQVYDDYEQEIIDKSIFHEILKLIQSYTWRRFILGLPTNALNKIFMNLYEKVDQDNYLKSIQKSLIIKTGVQRFPKNKEVIEALKTKDVYNIQSKNRVYFLDRLENHNNNELVSIENNQNITIEHIFPQNPSPTWRLNLEQEEFNNIKENYLNTISNLTLSGNNGKLGNKSFKEKKDLHEYGYKESRLWLNKYLSSIEEWNIETLHARFKIIEKRFLEIWQYPDIIIEDEINEDEINIFDAEPPKHKKLEYAIFFDQKIEVKQVAKLYTEVIKQLFELQPETFFKTDLAEKLSLTKTPELLNIRQPVQINDTYYIESNLDSNGKFEKLKYALTLLNLEDELSVKYAD